MNIFTITPKGWSEITQEQQTELRVKPQPQPDPQRAPRLLILSRRRSA